MFCSDFDALYGKVRVDLPIAVKLQMPAIRAIMSTGPPRFSERVLSSVAANCSSVAPH